MWDFDVKQVLKAMAATGSFILFRFLVYFGIVLGSILAGGIGTGVGMGIRSIIKDDVSAPMYGCLIGLGLACGGLYWLREYLLYLVKAGHIAVLSDYIDRKPVPGGVDQIRYAQAVVKERFKEASLLFAVDQFIKGLLKSVNKTILAIADFLPIGGLTNLVHFAQKIINLSVNYTDEIVLAYIIRTQSDDPWAASRRAMIYYAQNYKLMLKNAFFLLGFIYVCTIIIYLIFLIPIGSITALFPGVHGSWTFLPALLFAWCFKSAFIEPFAVCAMMQVFFKTIEGQSINAEWEEKILSISTQFQEFTHFSPHNGKN